MLRALRKAWLGMRIAAQPARESTPKADPAVTRNVPGGYDPEREAYGAERSPVKAAHAQFLGFQTAVREGRASLSISAIAYDGQREAITLSAAEASAYMACETADERRKYRYGRIKESRSAIAAKAVAKLREGRTLDKLTAGEEACLREFGALDGDVLREDFNTPWNGNASNVPYLDQEYLPYGQGPLGTQLYLADMWEMLAKAWWAWHHDPLAKRGINIVVSYVVGSGASIKCANESVQKVVDEFWARERMDLRLRTWLTDLGRDGELFLRAIPDGFGGCRARSLDPTTIWEIVTDAEDIERVYAYCQRYMTRTQLITVDGVDSQRYIERDLSPDDVIHVKINAGSGEVRGRSDLFVVLGYLKRLRDYFDSEVIKAQAAAAYHRDITIDGSDGDVQSFASQEELKGPPQPGESWYHNKSVEIKLVQGTAKQPAGNGSVYAGMVNLIAVGLGLSKELLGVTENASRASAEVSSDPAFQTFETRQQVVRDFVERLLQRVIAEAQRFGKIAPGVDLSLEVLFPAMVPEDKKTKVDLLATGEGMGWWSKRTAASSAAVEVPITDYNYEDQQDEIAIESKAVILKTYEQVPKGYPEATTPAFAPGDVPNPSVAKPAQESARRGITIIP